MIRLPEYGSWIGDLPDHDVSFIEERLRNRLDIQRLPGGAVRIAAAEHVGRVVLPSGRELQIEPKVPIGSLFQMIATAWGLPPAIMSGLIACETFSEALELVALYFARLSKQQIDSGLYTRYLDREENLPVVRGRIRFVENVRQNRGLHHSLVCLTSELTWDIPENQIIRQVAHALSGWGFNRATTLELENVDMLLAELSRAHFTPSAIDRFVYGRLNQSYRSIHQLCRLFLEHSSLTDTTGGVLFNGFLINMDALFEDFVTSTLQSNLGADQVWSQQPLALSTDGWFAGIPDLTIASRGRISSLGDCKYKTTPSNADLFQVLSYCTAAGADIGFVVYPKHELPVDRAIEIRTTGTVLCLLQIDLSQAGERLAIAGRDLSEKVHASLTARGMSIVHDTAER